MVLLVMRRFLEIWHRWPSVIRGPHSLCHECTESHYSTRAIVYSLSNVMYGTLRIKKIFSIYSKWLAVRDAQDARKGKDSLYWKHIDHFEWDTCSRWLHCLTKKLNLEYLEDVVSKIKKSVQFSSKCKVALCTWSWNFPLSVSDSCHTQL